MANNWVPSISAPDHTLQVLLGAILTSITMCSQNFHLLVAFYRRIQILLPSLGTLCMVTQEREMIPLCATNIPLCAPLMSKEAMVAVLRWLQVRNHDLGVWFFVVLESDFFQSQDYVHFGSKGAQRRSSWRIMREKSFMTFSNFIFPQTLEILKYFPDSLMFLSPVNPSTWH